MQTNIIGHILAGNRKCSLKHACLTDMLIKKISRLHDFSLSEEHKHYILGVH